MSPEQARELFSDAYEQALQAEEKRAFDAALAADQALAGEYAAFCHTLEVMHARPLPAPPNLLPGVQRRLRMQRREMSIRRRFGLGGVQPIALALLMLALAGLGFLALKVLEAALSR